MAETGDPQLVSSRSWTSPRDWDVECLRALQRCHLLAAAYSVGSPLSGIRSTPAGTAAGPAHPPKA